MCIRDSSRATWRQPALPTVPHGRLSWHSSTVPTYSLTRPSARAKARSRTAQWRTCPTCATGHTLWWWICSGRTGACPRSSPVRSQLLCMALSESDRRGSVAILPRSMVSRQLRSTRSATRKVGSLTYIILILTIFNFLPGSANFVIVSGANGYKFGGYHDQAWGSRNSYAYGTHTFLFRFVEP